jgi:hypothetical protein
MTVRYSNKFQNCAYSTLCCNIPCTWWAIKENTLEGSTIACKQLREPGRHDNRLKEFQNMVRDNLSTGQRLLEQ